MSKTIVVGDTHFKDQKGMYKAQNLFVDWFAGQPFNSEENIYG